MTAGVYAIFNLSNGFVYVGSSVNVEKRWHGRRWELNRGKSANRSLQADWSAVNGQGFEFRILEVTPNENTALLKAEETWIACLRAVSPGMYNVREASVGRHGFSMLRRGWSWVTHKRKAHYFVKGALSVCGQVRRVHAYRGFEDFNHDSLSNCAPCRKERERLIVERRARLTAYYREKRRRASRSDAGEG